MGTDFIAINLGYIQISGYVTRTLLSVIYHRTNAGHVVN